MVAAPQGVTLSSNVAMVSHDMKYDSLVGEHVADITISNRGPQERSSGFFYTLSCEIRVHRAGSQPKSKLKSIEITEDDERSSY